MLKGLLSPPQKAEKQRLLALIGFGLLAAGIWAFYLQKRSGDPLESALGVLAYTLPEEWARAGTWVEAEFTGRLPLHSAWAEELDQNPDLLEHLREKYWAQMPAFEKDQGGAYLCRWTADSFVVPLDGPQRPLAETLPGIRVLDLTLTLLMEGQGDSAVPLLEIRSGGGSLDAQASASLTETLRGQGLTVREIEAPSSQGCVPSRGFLLSGCKYLSDAPKGRHTLGDQDRRYV